MKRILSLILIAAMLTSLFGCAAQPVQAPEQEQLHQEENTVSETVDEMTREEKEQVVEILGDDTDTEELPRLSDEELDVKVENLVSKLEKEEPEVQHPQTDTTDDSVYDENGAMKDPYDVVYPEDIENGVVEFDDETLLIKLSNSLEGKITDGMAAAGVAALEEIVPMEKATWYEAKLLAGTDANAAIEALRQLKEVLLVEYNYEIQTSAIDGYKDFDDDHDFDGNDYHKDQWHMHHCGIPDGMAEMETDGGSSSVIVAVIDTGVDYDHEDLAQNMWVNSAEIPDNGIDDDGNGYVDDYYGVNIVAGKGNGDDDNGHGTHVAGIIAARNNNLGVVGIAYNVKIMTVKAAMASGTLNQSDIAKAILYAYEMGAEVINMSFGGTACSIAVQDALSIAYSRCVLVASAGNDGMPNEATDKYRVPKPNYPAALTYVLGVMSVDQYGVESSFTNWDANPFNGVEYELYAPGDEIMSTLPNDRYGVLSGTSMAAPVVSAIAAILRSEYSDRDMYPTKFIYGQLCSTSGYYATCLNPEDHSVNGECHATAQIVNLYDALTKLPKPEVNMQDYSAFDTESIAEGNNGDGVIDAGETIALGLTLRNRWGMSENTIVTIDTLSSVGIADPYVTIQNPSVNYGSVGTYSTQNCGAIYTDELLTGWEDPFYITIAKDCPNDYRIKLNVTITCENALDAEDTATYTETATIWLYVRNGVVLPSIIDEDMTLTADNLYIIPNSTVIQSGVTVRVEPGTHIQFWSADAEDPYADEYIAFLKVDGNFLVEGTKEKPVYIYPSDLMSHYVVNIASSSKGYVSLVYADITNFGGNNAGTKIDYAEHCTFRQNYESRMYNRYLSSGQVTQSYSYFKGDFRLAKYCVFYKIYNGEFQPSNYYSVNNIDSCIFVDCYMNLSNTLTSSRNSFRNCVFLGNNHGGNSKLQLRSPSLRTATYNNVAFYNQDTGTTYLRINVYDVDTRIGMYYAVKEFVEQELGGSFCIMETFEEYWWLLNQGAFSYSTNSSYSRTVMGLQKGANDEVYWSDGTPVGDFIARNFSTTYADTSFVQVGFHGATICNVEFNKEAGVLFEIPGVVLPTSITFDDYVVELGLAQTYQLEPVSTPVPLGTEYFIFESSDESVITVDENGLVTPVGTGFADVYVHYQDRAVYNYVRFYVSETAVEMAEESAPTFSVTAITVSDVAMFAQLSQKVKALPTVTWEGEGNTDLVWQSSDESVAVIENGQAKLVGCGTTTLRVTDRNSGISACTLLVVQESALSGIKQISVNYNSHYVLLDNGDLYYWSRNGITTPTCIASGVTFFDDYSSRMATVHADGTVKAWSIATDGTVTNHSTTTLPEGVAEKAAGIQYAYLSSTDTVWLHTEDGQLYVWGYNNWGQLGTGDTETVTEPTLSALENVVDVITTGTTTFFLTDDGKVYYTGYGYYYYDYSTETSGNVTTTSPVLLAEGIASFYDRTTYGDMFDGDDGIYYEDYSIRVLTADQHILQISTTGTTQEIDLDISQFDAVSLCSFWPTSTNPYGVAIRDGLVYQINGKDADGNCVWTQVAGISNAVSVYNYSYSYFVETADGQLLFFGNESTYMNHTAGEIMTSTTAAKVTTPVLIPLQPVTDADLVLTDWAWAEENVLKLVFNKSIIDCDFSISFAEEVVADWIYQIVNGNELDIYLTVESAGPVELEVIIEAGTVNGKVGTVNAEQITVDETCTGVIHNYVLDETVQRFMTVEDALADYAAFIAETQINGEFYGNAILNRISTDTNVDHWLRVTAPEASTYKEIPLGGNYWGTTNETAIGLQMVDYTDYISYARLMYEPYLTEAPENTFPFVTSVTVLNKDGEEVRTVGNETITVRVTFNRDMDTTIPLSVKFGSAEPYGDYRIPGEYVDPRTWEGTYTLNTLIENGVQYWNISNGCSATDDLELYADTARFFFNIDTTAAQALIMQGNATETGIQLTWTQDDFDTLMGYNIYRSTSEDGYYQRLNSTVIPADTMEWFDDTVEPGVTYYYNFTVVKTDLTESEPSGKITIMSMDTMAPNIYHSPVYSAFTGSNLIISATVTDNLYIAGATVYFRTVGETEWQSVTMTNNNSKYSAIIPAEYLSTAGLEYYIEAFDGVSYTYKGTADVPYTVTIQQAIDQNSMGDVNGDGVITNLDALMLLQAINDLLNLDAEQFARADLNGDGELSASEALRILQYVSGAVGDLIMP